MERKIIMYGLFLLQLFYVTGTQQVDTDLKLIQIVYRHGDRTPVDVYPNDIYNASIWDKYGGLGQLTQRGMLQHRRFGQYLRDLYSTFLSKYYDHNQVFARSTDYDRTLQSTYSLLSGLYPPQDYQIFDSDLAWQPVAVHTNDGLTDKIFYSGPCPRATELVKQVEKTDEYLQMEAENQDFFKLVSTKTGFTNIDIYNFWQVSDTLFVEESNNFTLPDWAQENHDRIEYLRDIGFYFDYRLPEMAKLLAGGVLNDVVKNINKKVNGSVNQLYLYGAHDTYVAALTKLLNISAFINQPPYVSALLFELRQSKTDGSYYVQIFLKNNTANQPINRLPMTIYECGDTLCPLEKFLQIVQDKVVVDFQSVCKVKSFYNFVLTNLTYFLIAIITSLVVLLVVGGAVYNLIHHRGSSKDGFSPL